MIINYLFHLNLLSKNLVNIFHVHSFVQKLVTSKRSVEYIPCFLGIFFVYEHQKINAHEKKL